MGSQGLAPREHLIAEVVVLVVMEATGDYWKPLARTEALTGRFADHHALLARVHLNLVDGYVHAIAELTTRIEVMIAPFRGVRDLLVSIPTVSTRAAEVIIAETGGGYDPRPHRRDLASWAGTCSGGSWTRRVH